jgi:DnaJ-class molecular chaperone
MKTKHSRLMKIPLNKHGDYRQLVLEMDESVCRLCHGVGAKKVGPMWSAKDCKECGGTGKVK